MSEAPEKDDKTEEPTQRRLDQAIERGDVAKSQELVTLFLLGGFTLALMISAGPLSKGLATDLRAFLMNAHQVPADGGGLLAAARRAAAAGFVALVVPAAIVALAALFGAGIQHRLLWTATPLAPKLERISPLAGAKRLFGKEAVVQFVKGLLKIAVVGAAATAVLWGERDRLDAYARLDVSAILPAALALAVKLMGAILAVYAVLAAGDWFYQRYTWMERQRMSRRELKEEFKEQEGSPEIKARVRQIRQSRLRKRMMAAVPTATVVVTNPTHYAVALRYESGMAAPVCVAKGVDALALRIRQVAGEHGIAIVENPPLARALHATVDIDEEIPVEHYKAVAEVVGYVLRLRRRRG